MQKPDIIQQIKTKLNWRKAKESTKRKCVKTIKNIPEEWPVVLCFSLKQLILKEAAVKYSAAQSVSAPAVWQLTWVSYWQSCLCVYVVYVLTCSGLIRNHSCVTNRTVDITCSSSGAEKPRTTTKRADSSAFWTDKRMYCIYKSSGLWKEKTPRCMESQQSWCIWHQRLHSPLYPLVPVCTPHSPSQ